MDGYRSLLVGYSANSKENPATPLSVMSYNLSVLIIDCTQRNSFFFIALLKVENRPKPQKIHFFEENQILLNCEGLSMLDIL